MQPGPLPEIDVQTLADKLRSDESFVLLDVREAWELAQASIADPRLQLAPMSRLAAQGIEALPQPAAARDATIYVLCHHGNRSGEVVTWLAHQGWAQVFNVRGGIDEYAAQVDPAIGMY